MENEFEFIHGGEEEKPEVRGSKVESRDEVRQTEDVKRDESRKTIVKKREFVPAAPSSIFHPPLPDYYVPLK